mmetsp:Transcript_35845/g.107226  ORF Transcript_35845/g.107226 Transcript_35845/m.107226 type:complete len:470 (+) Transcript_35845:651-2060(+)
MPPLCLEGDSLAGEPRGLLRLPDGGHRLDSDLEVDGRTRRDAPERTAGVVGRDAERGPPAVAGLAADRIRHEGVVVCGASHDGAAKAGADLEALGGRERHHGVRHLGLQPVEDRLAQRGRHAGADAGHRPADGVLLGLDLPDQRRHPARRRRVRAAEREQLVGAPAREVDALQLRLAEARPVVRVDAALPILVARHGAQCLGRAGRRRRNAALGGLRDTRCRGASVHADKLEEGVLRRNLGVDVRLAPLVGVRDLGLPNAMEGRRVSKHAQRAILVHLCARPADEAAALAARDGRLRQRDVPDRRDPAANLRPIRPAQPLFSDCARRDAADRLARGRAAAARGGLVAVLDEVGEVGVARPRDVAHLLVVARPLVLVWHKQADRRAQRVPVLGARQDLDEVLLGTRRGQARLARPSARQLRLDVRLGQREARRAAVDDRADALAVRLAKGRHAEDLAEGRHRLVSAPGGR